jgi:hypothetical protein
MEIVRDLFHGMAPVPIEVPFCPDTDADGSNTGYKGQLVKITDFDDIDHGTWVTLSTEATALENLCGILAEDVASGGSCYMLDSASGDWIRKKIFPILPSTVIRAEYGRKDAAGTACTDTAIYTATAGTTLTTPSLTANDDMIGGWVYFLTGNNANYLHYIKDNGSSTSATLATATANAGAATDTCLVIAPPLTHLLDFDATHTGLKSEIVDASRSETVQGIDYYVKAPGLNFQKLTRSLDGLYIPNAKFFHDFTIPGTAAGANVWVHGQAQT